MPQRSALGTLDALLGFEKVIEATWFFTERIEPTSLRTSLSRLASRYPLLASHVSRRSGRHRSPLHGWEIRGLTPEVPFGVRTEAGTSRAAASTTDASRFLGVEVRSGAAVMAGRSQVMAVALTNFDGGGSAVGVRLSHAVADASGFYRIVREWSRLHNGDGGLAGGDCAGADQDSSSGEDGAPLLELRRDCVEAAHQAARRAGPAPAAQEQGRADGAFDTSSWRGAALFHVIRALGPAPPPVASRRRLELSAADVLALRASCVAAGARRPSANEAVVASLCRAVSRALRLPPGARCSLSMVFDVRRAARLPPEYAGNAFHLLHAPATEAPWHEMPLAEVCALVRALALRPLQGNSLDDPLTLSGGWLALTQMLERGILAPTGGGGSADGGGGGGSGSMACSLVANYQAHLPAFAVEFGGGECLRVVPGAGDALQMVAGPRGGVDVYLNLQLGGGNAEWAQLREAVLDPARGG